MPVAWPPITEPELLERLAMDDAGFEAYMRGLLAALPAREYEAAVLARAVEYPWARPSGSYLLASDRVQPLAELDEAERERVIGAFSASPDRHPVLAIGSNGSPEALERKFAHFEADDDRSVLVLTGRLHDFDVGVAAQPALYGAMPATIFPSPGTSVRAALLRVTAAQFTQLAWTELSYRLGRLRTRFEVDQDGGELDEVLVFVSRFGAFSRDRRPLALAAVPASGRTAEALEQEALLDAAARLAIGPEATAETLVRAIHDDFNALVPRIAETVWRESTPFESERWTPFTPG